MWAEKHGRTYRIRDRVGDQIITIDGGYPTKTAARNAITQLEADRLRGDQLVPRGGQMLLTEWLDVWWPGYEAGLKPSARVSAEGLVRRYVRPMLGRLSLDEVDQLVVQRWVADLRAGRAPVRNARPLAPKTVRNAHGQLHTIMAAAVRQRLIRSNPCADTGLPEAADTEMRFLTEPEAERLLAAVPDHWRPLVLLMLFTGLRWGEAIGLRVGQVDVLARRLTVVTQLQELAGSAEIVEVTPKSRRSRRTVTFPVRVADALVELVANRPRTALVFVGRDGAVVRHSNFRNRVWHRALVAAGLDGLRLHDLRHTHAAWLISAGVPILAISRRLGHASITVTMDRYGHLLPEVDAGIMTALDGALDKMGHVIHWDDFKIDPGSTVGATEPTDPDATGQDATEHAGQDGSEAHEQGA